MAEILSVLSYQYGCVGDADVCEEADLQVSEHQLNSEAMILCYPVLMTAIRILCNYRYYVITIAKILSNLVLIICLNIMRNEPAKPLMILQQLVC